MTTTHTTHPPTESIAASNADSVADTSDPGFDSSRQRSRVAKAIATKTFCTLATTSPAGRPHVAGVIYEYAGGRLWVHTMRTSRKARSIAANPHVAICIPYRRLPVGPPYTIQFQARAEIVEMDDPVVRRLLDDGKLKEISGHGALDMPDGCFLSIEPGENIHSYGTGVPTLDLIRDPLTTGGRTVRIPRSDLREAIDA